MKKRVLKRNYCLNYGFLVLLLVILSFGSGCVDHVIDGSQAFDGDVIRNEEQFSLSFSSLNSTKAHEMRLEAGESVQVMISILTGRLDITVADMAGGEIYRGNNTSSGEFRLTIPRTSTYLFVVKGQKAGGAVEFKATARLFKDPAC